jgi:hypothetical protein
LYEFGNRIDLKLAHQVGAMAFHRALVDTEFRSDLLVQSSEGKSLPLAAAA